MSGIVPLLLLGYFKISYRDGYVEVLVQHFSLPRTIRSLIKCGQLKFFHRYYFDGCISELAEAVSLPCSCGRSTCYSNKLCDLSVTIPRSYKDINVNNFHAQPGSRILCLENTFLLPMI